MPGPFTHIYTARRVADLLRSEEFSDWPDPPYPGTPSLGSNAFAHYDPAFCGEVMQKWEKFTSIGAIGEENAYLLGNLIVAKLHQATLSRQNIAENERVPFFLYLDEAHHFMCGNESMSQILSGVRKYKLGLIFSAYYCHQRSL